MRFGPRGGGTARTRPPDRSHRRTILDAAAEVALVGILFLAYKAGRLIINGHVDEALDNGWWIWNAERWLRLPDESAVQAAVLGSHLLVKAANIYYAYVHFPATAACLVWMYLRNRTQYVWIRRVLAALTAASLVLHLVAPLAPPRMLTATGIVDTARSLGPAVYGPPDTDTLSNQYAAMPSLHVGWAVAVAIALIAMTRSRWRWLFVLHPVVTLLVVVVTGNHYWLDAVAATALLAVLLVLVPRPLEVSGPFDRSASPQAPTGRTHGQPTPHEHGTPVQPLAAPVPLPVPDPVPEPPPVPAQRRRPVPDGAHPHERADRGTDAAMPV